jgi:hypothetical protein
MLIALNANDRAYGAHQYNAIPAARAKGMGIIAMKIFSDGTFYGKEARFSRNAADTYVQVGKAGDGWIRPIWCATRSASPA